jgi:hypothetical protein
MKRLLDTTGFSRVVLQFQPKGSTETLLDTTGFSRVVLQFQPNEVAKISIHKKSIHWLWRGLKSLQD